MSKFCVICGKVLTGRQRNLCSDNECYKERKREISCKYRQNNPERILERNLKYYQNNPEKMQEYSRRRYQRDREKILERNREYQQNNIEKIKENQREYYQRNQEKIKKRSNEYYQNNRDEKKEYRYNYYWKNQEKELEHKRRQYRRFRGLPEDADLHKESSIEIITKEWLQENNIEFIPQYYINLKSLGANWTYVDFFIEPNICLYSNGDYHHGPKRPDIQERDAKINKALESGGYSVIRLSETEILEGNIPWG